MCASSALPYRFILLFFRADIIIILTSVVCIVLEAITINRLDYIAEHLVFVRSLKLLRFIRLKNRYYTFIRIIKVLMLRLFRRVHTHTPTNKMLILMHFIEMHDLLDAYYAMKFMMCVTKYVR